jgi:hypothetical protein
MRAHVSFAWRWVELKLDYLRPHTGKKIRQEIGALGDGSTLA